MFGWISECPPADGHRNILNTVNRNEIGLGYYTGSTTCWSRLYFGDIANNAPSIYTLPAGAHRPETGSTVDFYVNYYDPGGAPQSANVVVDGACTPVSLEIGSGSNGTYHANVNVGSGCHQYWFLVYDSAGNRVTYPEMGRVGCGQLHRLHRYRHHRRV